MNRNPVVQILRERGLVDEITSPTLETATLQRVTVYAGFDPSSDSLQAGNLAAAMVLAHFRRCGHRVIALIGGATGMIGDPSGKSSERALLDADQVTKNMLGIRENLTRILGVSENDPDIQLVNNADWFARFSFIDFLRDVGKHFRMGAMLAKDSVRSRLSSESGMSFTEFSYQLLQAYDFLHLYDSHSCTVQIGGSDQWGNITAGTDLVRKLRSVEVFGLTIPLICDSAGQKFGKSEGNAVFLSPAKTSVYDFYQFFLRTQDADVARFLKIFTFLPLAEIAELEQLARTEPERREAQRRLAAEVTRIVHGEAGLAIALRSSAILFGESMDGLDAAALLQVFANVPSAALPRERLVDTPVTSVAAAAGMCRSASEARRLIESGGFYLNNARVADVARRIGSSDLIDGKLLVLRSGRKNFFLVQTAD